MHKSAKILLDDDDEIAIVIFFLTNHVVEHTDIKAISLRLDAERSLPTSTSK